MKQDETHIVKVRDFAEIIKAPNNELIADFLEQPFSVITETLTGFLASGPKEWTLSVGRIVQAPFKAKLHEQVAKEIAEFRNKGKINDDFANRMDGAKTWVDLFTIIDEESPDEEKLDALKAMFFSVNKINIDDAERIKQYQIFQLAKKLSSNDLIVLKAAFEQETPTNPPSNHNFDQWASRLAQSIGHSITALIDIADRNLEEHGFFKRLNRDSNAVIVPRLTDLGYQLCHDIKWYHIEKNRIVNGFYEPDASK
jgi:hypothetical protein